MRVLVPPARPFGFAQGRLSGCLAGGSPQAHAKWGCAPLWKPRQGRYFIAMAYNVYCAVYPPSTTRGAPVTKDDSSEARKSAA
jgi:hypothetical protein